MEQNTLFLEKTTLIHILFTSGGVFVCFFQKYSREASAVISSFTL